MTPQAFNALLRHRTAKRIALLNQKGQEYGRGADRLSNFKKAAALQGCTPARACFGFLAKHLVSVADLIADEDRGVLHPMVVWEEKLGDVDAYLPLLEALVLESKSRPG